MAGDAKKWRLTIDHFFCKSFETVLAKDFLIPIFAIAIFVATGDDDGGGDGGLVVRRNQFLIRSNGCGKPIWPHNFSILLSCQGEGRQCLDQNIGNSLQET